MNNLVIVINYASQKIQKSDKEEGRSREMDGARDECVPQEQKRWIEGSYAARKKKLQKVK
jgi:hypothetical protein